MYIQVINCLAERDVMKCVIRKENELNLSFEILIVRDLIA